MPDFDVMFCDTCVGGSTVAATLAAARTGLSAFYLADYAVNPLGVKSRDEVQAALRRWVRLTLPRSATLVIACNTASVLFRSSPEIQAEATRAGLRVVSMVDFLERHLAADPQALAGKRVCLMGTRFTVSQPVYRELLAAAGGREIVPLGATRTEGVIARLRHESEAGRREIVEEIGETIRSCDAVILGCTLFPLIGGLIRKLNPACALHDPGAGVAAVLPPRAEPGGVNRMTLAVSGTALSLADLRQSAPALFPGWEIAEVIAV
jgi:glutamate racemase